MDKTFAETKGQPPFDWNKALDNPPKVHTAEHFGLVYLADSWVTCACGNQCAIIPRSETLSHPMDKILAALGMDFAFNVRAANWRQAKLTLAQIEARSTILIAEELAKLNAKGAEWSSTILT